MRTCVACGSETTFVNKKGHAHWYNHNGWHCQKCNNKLFHNPKYKPITSKRRINFKGKGEYLKSNPRTGICKICHKSIGDTFLDQYGKERIIKKTHLHHTQYHEDDPLRDTIEVCPQCHINEHWRSGTRPKRPKILTANKKEYDRLRHLSIKLTNTFLSRT